MKFFNWGYQEGADFMGVHQVFSISSAFQHLFWSLYDERYRDRSRSVNYVHLRRLLLAGVAYVCGCYFPTLRREFFFFPLFFFG